MMNNYMNNIRNYFLISLNFRWKKLKHNAASKHTAVANWRSSRMLLSLSRCYENRSFTYLLWWLQVCSFVLFPSSGSSHRHLPQVWRHQRYIGRVLKTYMKTENLQEQILLADYIKDNKGKNILRSIYLFYIRCGCYSKSILYC